jgi:hypothetical protein
MKADKYLSVSLAVNVIAVGVLIGVIARRQPGTSVAKIAVPAPAPVPSRTEPGETAAAKPALPATIAISSSGDWARALRAAGVTEKLIADVAAADFEGRWQVRMREIQKKFNAGEIDEDELAKFYLHRDTEQETEMRAALGEEGFKAWDQRRLLQDYDMTELKLSAEDTEALYQLRKSYEKQSRDLERSRQQGDLDEADMESKAEARQNQFNEQLKKLLGDDRFASIQNAGDPSAADLRRSLKNMHATDEQSEQMLKAQQAWTEERAKLEKQLQQGQVVTADYEQKTKAIEAARDEAYQKALGAEGYADLQKNQDSRYQTLKRFGPAWGLSDGDVNSLYGTIKSYETSVRDYQERARAIEQQGQAVDWPAVQQALKDYAKQTEDTLQKTLGEERFRRLKRNNVVALDQQ